MTLTMPSSKWWASTIVSTVTVLVLLVTAAQDQGVELPEWLALVGAVLGPIVVYVKAENRPSPSARKAIQSGA